MTRKERLRKRNRKVREYVQEFERKNPQWKKNAIKEEAALHFFISVRTVEAILWSEGTYSKTTLKRF